MKIIDQSYEILFNPDCSKLIETVGRTAYKSENKITNDSAPKFIDMINSKNHGAVLEHSILSVKFITDRGISHELVRHRLASFCQESTRYCNYSKDKFNNELTFIRPIWFSWEEINRLKEVIDDPEMTSINMGNCTDWLSSIKDSEFFYLRMLSNGQTPQQARALLPNSLKTEIVVTTNYREWQHIFNLRAVSKAAHPQMRALMIPLYMEMKSQYPYIFNLGEIEE
jgi:thymidylate synthase (FAD)